MPTATAPEAVVATGADAADATTGFDAGFDDDAENIDEDIREVFLEEFDDELANLGTLLPAWRMQPDNMDRCARSAASSIPSRAVAAWLAHVRWASSRGRSKACSTACWMAAAPCGAGDGRQHMRRCHN